MDEMNEVTKDIALLTQNVGFIRADIVEIKQTLTQLTSTLTGLQTTQNVHSTKIFNLERYEEESIKRFGAIEKMIDTNKERAEQIVDSKLHSLQTQIQANRDWRIKLTGIAIGAGAGAGGLITAIINAIK